MATAKASDIKQLKNYIFAPSEYAAHFHVQVEELKDRYDIVPREKEVWQFVRRKKTAKRQRSEQRNDLRENTKCMRCGTCSMRAQFPRSRRGFTLMEKDFFFFTAADTHWWP